MQTRDYFDRYAKAGRSRLSYRNQFGLELAWLFSEADIEPTTTIEGEFTKAGIFYRTYEFCLQAAGDIPKENPPNLKDYVCRAVKAYKKQVKATAKTSQQEHSPDQT